MMTTAIPTGVVFGESLVDDFGTSQRLGGAPFNVAQHLQGLGVPAIFVSRTGHDAAGTQILQRLQAWHMAVDAVQMDATLPTGRVGVIADPLQRHRFEILPHQAYDAITLPGSLPPTIPWLYHGSLALREEGPSRASWRSLCAKATWRFVDINLRDPWWHPELLTTFVRHSSILKCNVDELDRLLSVYKLPSSKNLSEKMQSLALHFQAAAVLLTRGEEGSAYWDGQQYCEAVATPVRFMQDTVGAGDAFAAGWLWSYFRGEAAQIRLQRGGELAAAICGLTGATPDTRTFYHAITSRWIQED